ncbi:Transcriptional regulator of acetoin/glycerol metabolism [Rhizobiales bacterium GAS191]|nr:Transcriptional regulator of acetoin/glycerol metabolism [Rhizobiales bacterium GAS191]
MLSIEDRTARARAELDRLGTVSAEWLSPEIQASWSRCVAARLDPRRPPPLRVLEAPSLREARQRHEAVLRLALAEMSSLHSQIAGTNFVIAFASPNGTLLDMVADDSFSTSVHAASVRPGSIWSEANCGTNALGTTAIVGRRVIVHGGEHFFPRYGALACMASPVFAPDGTLAGILDASSDCRSRQEHTQALLAMAAIQIENGLFREQHREDLVIAFHSRGEYLQTLSAGLVAVDADGNIRALNGRAKNFLSGLPTKPGKRFGDLFRTDFGAFVQEVRKRERHRLEDKVGSSFIATIESGLAANAVRPKAPRHGTSATGFVADDAGVRAILRQVETAALRQMPILIRGETGTGKEQMARHAHAASGRGGEFVPVNCAALPESLIEAELFGYSDGAFTGARRGGAVGLVKEADGGTLFLDEIGDMPVALQAVLLRLLDDWTVRPIGGTRSKVDVLLVSATNAKLDRAIAEGRFRADLLYRLNTLEVTLPPLGDRRDFEAIVRHLMRAIDPECEITSATISSLARRPWPGNIRELRNILARLTLSATDGVIGEAEVEMAAIDAPAEEQDSFRAVHSLHAMQQARILAAHAAAGGNISETARRLGVSRNTIYRALAQKLRS